MSDNLNRNNFESLKVLRDGEPVEFRVEVMRTQVDRERGLMHRDKLGPDCGMLFVEDGDTPIRMWMKDTPLELDVLFLRSDGIVHRIEPRLQPMSERMVWSHGIVRAMLEIPGGRAEELGLRSGDRVDHQSLGGAIERPVLM